MRSPVAPRRASERRLTVAGPTRPTHAVSTPPHGLYVRLVKPVFDRVVGFCIFVVLLPLTAVVAVAVRVSLGSPVIFRQRRVGRNGQEFDVYKFRTMAPGPAAPARRPCERTGARPTRARTTRATRASGGSCASGAWTSCPSSGTWCAVT